MGDGRYLVIVDLDGEPGAVLDALEADGLPLPPTLRASTPRGGQHMFYWSTETDFTSSVKIYKCAAGAVDIRADRAHVVAAPSPGYQFLDPIFELSELPAWVKQRQEAPKERPTPAPRATATGDLDKRIRAYLTKCPPAIQGSRGSDTTISAATGLVIGFELSDSEAMAYLAEWNATCVPPWEQKDLERKVAEARKCSTRKPGYLLVDRPKPVSHLRSVPKPTEPEPRIEGNTALKPQQQERTGYGPECWVYPTLGQVSELDTRAEILWDCFKVKKNVISNQIECLIDGKVVTVTQDEKLNFISFIQKKMPDHFPGGEPVKASQKAASLTEKAIGDAVCRCAYLHQYNPVTDWLNSLPKWDGNDYLDQLAVMVGDEHQARCKAFVTRWLIGTCKRAFEPGCVMDVSLWFWGNEGPGKSSLFRGLVNDEGWFMDISKAAVMNSIFSIFHFNSAWIIELAEVDQFRTVEMRSQLKAWLTTPVDKGMRKGRNEMESIARRFSVAGTTNKKVFADGEERRWLPVHHAKPLCHAELKAMRPQLWAQVLALYSEGESFRLNETEKRWHAEAIAEQGECMDDSYVEIIEEYLASFPSKGFYTYSDIYGAIALSTSVPPRRDRREDVRIMGIMLELGYRRAQRGKDRARGFELAVPVSP